MIATWAGLVLAVIALLALVIGPRLGGYHVSVVLSNSMQPHWQAGDLVITTPVRAQDLRVGQVISYNPPIDGRPSITHRIVNLTEPGPTPIVTTKGDANEVADSWGAVRLDPGTVWVVNRSVPKLGWAIAFMRRPAVNIIATVVAPLLLMMLLLRRIWQPRVVTG